MNLTSRQIPEGEHSHFLTVIRTWGSFLPLFFHISPFYIVAIISWVCTKNFIFWRLFFTVRCHLSLVKGWSIWSQPLGDADAQIVPAPLALPLHPFSDRTNRGEMTDRWKIASDIQRLRKKSLTALMSDAYGVGQRISGGLQLKTRCSIDFHFHHPLSAATTVSRQMVSAAREAVAAMVRLWASREVWTGWGNWLSVTEKWEKSMISIKATWVVSVAYNQPISSFALISCFPFWGLP